MGLKERLKMRQQEMKDMRQVKHGLKGGDTRGLDLHMIRKADCVTTVAAHFQSRIRDNRIKRNR